MARRDQDQLLVEEMLDDQAGAIRRPVHDCEVESAFDQPIHQSDRGSGRRRHRNVGDIFAHPGEPLEEKSVPQTRLSAYWQMIAMGLGGPHFESCMLPDAHEREGVFVELLTGRRQFCAGFRSL